MTEKSLVQILIELLPAAAFGLFGGFVELMRYAEKATVNARFIISSLCVAGFVGMVVSLLMYDVETSEAVKGATVGVAGASARNIMEILKKRVSRTLGGQANE